MLKISACVIVKNEEKNLPQWIEGVRGIVDEMIVVDTGSTDATMEIAREAGARVYSFPWVGDFSAAKNYALSKATGSWIVFLDADEYFTPESRKRLRSVIRGADKDRRIVGLLTPLYNINVDDGGSVMGSMMQLRLFRNLKYLRYKGRIHEVLKLSPGMSGETRDADLIIHHTGYSASIIRAKHERNLKLLLTEAEAAGGEGTKTHFYLSTTYLGLGENEKAIHYAKLAIASKSADIKERDYIEQYDIWYRAAKNLNASYEELRDIVDQALALIPDHADFLWNSVNLDFDHEEYVAVEPKLLKIIRQAENPDLAKKYLTYIYRELPRLYAMLGLLRTLQGRTEEAIEAYIKSLRKEPESETVLEKLLDILYLCPAKEAIHLLDGLYDKERDREFLAKCFSKRPRDLLYLTYVRPEEGSYEWRMCEGECLDAARMCASYLASHRESMTPDVAIAVRDLSLALFHCSSQEFAEVGDMVSLLPETFADCLRRFHGGDAPLTERHLETFCTLRREILRYGWREVVSRAVLLAADFSTDVVMETAALLAKKGAWEAAFALYQTIPADSPAVTGEFWYRVGLCFFYGKESETTKECFAKAKEMGCDLPEMEWYLAWCGDEVSEG